ncbi:MAG: hypothetical protein P1Q69_03455 [Candidatus Thorarchaeota archaeon]|nr:hypothetical protein [Candidatus Thorarchaeota archaeon]
MMAKVSLVTNFFLPLGVAVYDENSPDGMPDNQEVAADLIFSILETFALAYYAQKIIVDVYNYKDVKYEYFRDPGKTFGKAFGYAAIGVGFIGSAFSMFARTLLEIKHSWI